MLSQPSLLSEGPAGAEEDVLLHIPGHMGRRTLGHTCPASYAKRNYGQPS